MTKKEYLRALQNEIQALPNVEQKEAVEYYENYFLDAGIENEQKVIEELGSVQELAKEILSNFACVPQTVHNEKKKKNGKKKESKAETNWVIIAVIILTFPLWINIVAALFGLLVSLLAIGFSGIVAAIAIFIAAIAMIGISVWSFVTNPLVALFLFGACCILIGIGIVAWIIGLWFFAKFIPWVWNGAKTIYSNTKEKIKSKI